MPSSIWFKQASSVITPTTRSTVHSSSPPQISAGKWFICGNAFIAAEDCIGGIEVEIGSVVDDKLSGRFQTNNSGEIDVASALDNRFPAVQHWFQRTIEVPGLTDVEIFAAKYSGSGTPRVYETRLILVNLDDLVEGYDYFDISKCDESPPFDNFSDEAFITWTPTGSDDYFFIGCDISRHSNEFQANTGPQLRDNTDGITFKENEVHYWDISETYAQGQGFVGGVTAPAATARTTAVEHSPASDQWHRQWQHLIVFRSGAFDGGGFLYEPFPPDLDVVEALMISQTFNLGTSGPAWIFGAYSSIMGPGDNGAVMRLNWDGADYWINSNITNYVSNARLGSSPIMGAVLMHRTGSHAPPADLRVYAFSTDSLESDRKAAVLFISVNDAPFSGSAPSISTQDPAPSSTDHPINDPIVFNLDPSVEAVNPGSVKVDLSWDSQTYRVTGGGQRFEDPFTSSEIIDIGGGSLQVVISSAVAWPQSTTITVSWQAKPTVAGLANPATGMYSFTTEGIVLSEDVQVVQYAEGGNKDGC